jgi:hypothetical protein
MGSLFLSRDLCSNPLVVKRVQVENDLLLMAQEPKANNVAWQQCDDQRRAVMHEWPVSLTDDRFKEWCHLLGFAAFRNCRIKFCS